MNAPLKSHPILVHLISTGLKNTLTDSHSSSILKFCRRKRYGPLLKISVNELVFVKNDRVVTDFLTVAEVIGKEHKIILRGIRTQMGYAGEEFAQYKFIPGNYTDKNNQERPKFNLTEEAFTVIMFSYNTNETFRQRLNSLKSLRDETIKS